MTTAGNRVRRVLLRTAIAGGGVIALSVAALALLHVDGVATGVARWVAARVNPYAETHLTVERVELRWPGQITVRGLALAPTGGSILRGPELNVQLLQARVATLALLHKTVDVREAELVGTTLSVAQRDDSTWNFTPGSPRDDRSEEGSDGGSGWQFRSGPIRVDGLRAEVAFAPSTPGSPAERLRVEDLSARIGALAFGGGPPTLRVDSLSTRFLPPGPAPGPVVVSGGAALEGGRLSVPALTLQSDASDLTARGSLLLPGATHDEIEEIDFDISAAPLALRDVSGFLRTVDPTADLTGHAILRGQASRAELSMHAELSGGGTADVEGVFAPLLPGLVRAGSARELEYRVRATVEALRLEALLAAGSVAGPLTASVDVDLRGPERSRLDGVVDAQVEGLRVGGWPLTRSTLDGTVTDGAVSVDLAGGVEGLAETTLHLTGRPLDPSPTLMVQGDLRQLEGGPDRENPLVGAGVTGLHARLEAAFAGAPSLGALTDLDVETVAGAVFDRSLAGGTVEATWTGDTADVRIDQPIGEGHVAGSGTVTDAWAGLEHLAASVDLDVRRIAVRDLVLDSAALGARLAAGSLAAEIEAWTTPGSLDPAAGSGYLTARLDSRPFDPAPYVDLDTLAFRELDLLGPVPLRTSLNGAGRARLDGFDVSTAALSAELELDASSIGTAHVESGDVALSLSSGRLDARIDASSPGGAISARGHALPFEPVPQTVLDELRLRGLDLGRLQGGDAPDTDLNLDITLTARGASWADLDAVGQVELLPSSVRSGSIAGGRLALRASEGTATVDGALRSGTGTITVAARAEGLERPSRVDVDLGLDVDDLSDFVGLDGDLAVVGTAGVMWHVGGAVEFSTTLSGRTPYGDVDRLASGGALDRSVLRLDSLLLSSAFAEARGAGSFALDVTGAEPKDNELEFQFVLADRAPSLSLPVLGPTSIAFGRGQLVVGGGPEARSLRANLDVGPWRATRASGVGVVAAAEYGSGRFALDLVAPSVVSGDTLKVVVRGRQEAAGGSGVLEQFELSSAAAAWRLSSPVAYSLGDDVTVDNLELSSAAGTMRVDGTFSRVAEHDLTVSVEDARLSWLTAALDLEDLRFLANGELVLSGSASRPVVDASAELVVGLVNQPPGTIRGKFSMEDFQASIDVRALDPSGEELRLTGTTPLGRPDGSVVGGTAPAPVELTMEAGSFDVSWLGALVPRSILSRLQGELSADLNVRGDLDAPEITGDVSLESGRLRLGESGPEFEDLRLVAAMSTDEVRIAALEASSGPGTLRAQGRIGLDGLHPDDLGLSATFDRFVGWSDASLTAITTGSLTVRGTFDEPLIEGSVALDGSRLNLDDASSLAQAETVELTEEDYRMLEDYFGYAVDQGEDVGGPSLLDRVGLRLSVRWDRDVWVTRFPAPRLSLESRGNLEIEKSSGSPLLVTGAVEALPERSYFRQFGRRFSLEEGVVTLTGDPALYSVNARARWEVPSRSDPNEPDVVVILEVSGDADGLSLTLSSDPEMDESDIVSYLATGTAPGVTTASDAGLGTAIALGAAAGAIEGLAAEHVPLDVVEVATDPVRGTTLVAGRYFTPRLYLGFRQPVSFGQSSSSSRTESDQSEAELEYQWFRWLTMNLQGGVSEFRLFLRSQLAY